MNQKQTGGWVISPGRSPGRSPSRTKKNSPKSKDRNKLQNHSQSQSGGRRRKSTMRKLRRGRKSRKVMRGGGYDHDFTTFDNDKINKAIKEYNSLPGKGPDDQVKLGVLLSETDNDKINEAIKEYNSLPGKGPNDQVKLGVLLSETAKISEYTKNGIMMRLNPAAIELKLN